MRYALTIRDHIDRAELVYPDRLAVVDEPHQPAASMDSLSYQQFAAAARAQAAKLDRLGVKRGARVVIVSQNSARLLASFFGVSGWGRVLVPVNFRIAAPEVEYIVRNSEADVVYADPSCAKLLDRVDATHKFVLGDDDDLYLRDTEPVEWSDRDEEAVATINYTSGTTARPKGVQLTHRNLWLNSTVFGLHSGISEDDVYLHTLPMFHVNGWGMPYAITAIGGQHIILRQVDGAEILRRIEKHRVSLLCCAPAVLNTVLEAARAWSGEIPGRNRVRVICAGAPPPSLTIERVIRDLGWEFCQLYGLTETSPLLTINRMRSEWRSLPVEQQAQRLVRAGVPALGVRLKTASDGEILAMSNHNSVGYWQAFDESAVAQRNSWFHTGDKGLMDQDGFLVISDRKKDVIVTGGENVSSMEVEEVLTRHPAVREVAVIGTPDEKWGEMVTALIVTDGSSVMAEDLIHHCRSALAGYKCPKRIEFRDELPRTATGKLQKFLLREPYWSGLNRRVN